MDNQQHIYHHNDKEPSINVSIEKNTKGFNYTVTVMNAPDIETALRLLKDARAQLEKELGRETQ